MCTRACCGCACVRAFRLCVRTIHCGASLVLLWGLLLRSRTFTYRPGVAPSVLVPDAAVLVFLLPAPSCDDFSDTRVVARRAFDVLARLHICAFAFGNALRMLVARCLHICTSSRTSEESCHAYFSHSYSSWGICCLTNAMRVAPTCVSQWVKTGTKHYPAR